MKLLLRNFPCLQVFCIAWLSAFASGQAPDARDSLAACNAGLHACEASRTVPPRLPAAGSPEQKLPGAAELSDRLVVCTNGWETCEFSLLAQADLNSSEHQRNISDCRNGSQACDRSKLTSQEAIALAVADHKRNLSDCTGGFTSSDHSRLTASE